MAMILQKPNISRSRPSSLMKDDKEYNKIFNEKNQLDSYLKLIRIQKIILL